MSRTAATRPAAPPTTTIVSRRGQAGVLILLALIAGFWLWALLRERLVGPGGEPRIRITAIDAAPVTSLQFTADGTGLLISSAGPGGRSGARGGAQLVFGLDIADADLPTVRGGAFGRVPVRRARTLRAYRGDPEALGPARFAPGGALVFTASNPITVWDASTDKVRRALKAGGRACTWLPDGHTLVWQRSSSVADSDLLVQEADTGRLRMVLPAPLPLAGRPTGSVVALEAVADGKTLVALAGGQVTLYDLAAAAPVGRLGQIGDPDALCVAASPADTADMLFATGHTDGTVRLWGRNTVAAGGDAGTVSPLRILSVTPPSGVNAVAFSASGTQIAVGTRDGRVLLFAPRTGAILPGPLARNRRDASAVTALAFAPDGHSLAVGDSEGNVTLWLLPLLPPSSH